MITKEEKPGEVERCDRCGSSLPSLDGWHWCRGAGRQPAAPAEGERDGDYLLSEVQVRLLCLQRGVRVAELESALAASKARVRELEDEVREAYSEERNTRDALDNERSQLSAATAENARLTSERDEWKASCELAGKQLTEIGQTIASMKADNAEIARLRGLLEEVSGRLVNQHDRCWLRCDVCGHVWVAPGWLGAEREHHEVNCVVWRLRSALGEKEATTDAPAQKLAAVRALANQWWNAGDEVDALYAEKLRAVLAEKETGDAG